MSTKHPRQRGQLLIELLIAIALMGLLMPVLISGLVIGRDSKPQQEQRESAALLLTSTQEILRVVRERGWSFVATDGTYHPVVDGTSWQLASGPDTQQGLTRRILIAPVRRDVAGTIVTSGGTLDPSTKQITTRIAWTVPNPGQIESVSYMTRYLDNITQTDSTVPDFEAGTHLGTTTISTSGEDGQVILGSGGSGGWCSPFESQVGEIDLPKNGVANAITAVEGRAFIGTGDNASGVSFAEVTVANTDPPSAAVSATFDGYKTNDVFGEVGYAYLATDTNSEEIVIINTATQSKVGWFDAPGSDNAEAVYVQGTTGYVVQGNKLYNFNLESKNGSRECLVGATNCDRDGVTLSGIGTKVEVKGDYAFIALQSGFNELEVVNVSNKASLQSIGQTNIGTQPARDVVINSSSTRAFVITNISAGEPELYVLDITGVPAGSRTILGNLDTDDQNPATVDMNPKGITLVPGNRVIMVGHGGEEYQVAIVNDTGSSVGISRCGGLDLNLNINGVASVYEADGDAYSYIITSSIDAEFKMLEGGPGGQFSQNGSFESRTLDAGYTTAFNYVIVTKQEPPQTTLRFQVAVADAVNNSCDAAVFSYVGPQASSGAFFTDEGAIPLGDDGLGYENPGRCFRYKAYLDTTDSAQSPVLESMQVNYSP